MYKCQNFIIEELVPPELMILNEKVLWGLFDPNLLKFADWLKEFCDGAPVTINNWKWGGLYEQSGIRTTNSRYYSKTSYHSVGKALDLKVKGWTAEKLRQALKAYEASGKEVPYITRIEEGVSWLHVDTKVTGLNKIYYFNP